MHLYNSMSAESEELPLPLPKFQKKEGEKPFWSSGRIENLLIFQKYTNNGPPILYILSCLLF